MAGAGCGGGDEGGGGGYDGVVGCDVVHDDGLSHGLTASHQLDQGLGGGRGRGGGADHHGRSSSCHPSCPRGLQIRMLRGWLVNNLIRRN